MIQLIRKRFIFATVTFKPLTMKHLNSITSLFFLLALFFLTSCDDDEDTRVPSIRLMTAQEFTRCVDGKGWRHVESHEIKSNGNMDKADWWSGMIGAAPVQYSFGGGEMSTYMYIDSYPINGYVSGKYTFDEGTNRLMSDGKEVFTVVSADDNFLRLIKQQGTTGDGERIYLYSVYRAMTADELSATKEKYSINLNTLDQDYPLIPAQETITAESFAANIVGSTWHCAEVHETFLAYRYNSAPYTPGKSQPAVPDYEFTADSLYSITPSADGDEATRRATAYTYRANGFYVETASGDIIKIVRLTADEMVAVQPLRNTVGVDDVTVYCVYRR